MLYQLHNIAKINKIINTKRTVLILHEIFAFKETFLYFKKAFQVAQVSSTFNMLFGASDWFLPYF